MLRRAKGSWKVSAEISADQEVCQGLVGKREILLVSFEQAARPDLNMY